VSGTGVGLGGVQMCGWVCLGKAPGGHHLGPPGGEYQLGECTSMLIPAAAMYVLIYTKVFKKRDQKKKNGSVSIFRYEGIMAKAPKSAISIVKYSLYFSSLDHFISIIKLSDDILYLLTAI